MTKNYKLFITAILFLFGFYFIISKNLDLNTKSINFLIILRLIRNLVQKSSLITSIKFNSFYLIDIISPNYILQEILKRK